MYNRKIVSVLLLLLCLSLPFSAESSIFKKENRNKFLLAILPFENKTGNDKYDKIISEAYYMLFEHLYKMNKFRIVEMEKIGDIIGEKLDKNGQIDRDSYLKAIKTLGAEVVLFCNFRKITETLHKNKNIISVVTDGRLVRLLNGEILCVGSSEETSKVRIRHYTDYNSSNDIKDNMNVALKRLAKYISKHSD